MPTKFTNETLAYEFHLNVLNFRSNFNRYDSLSPDLPDIRIHLCIYKRYRLASYYKNFHAL